MTSTGLFLPLLNDSCTTTKNKPSCEYKGKSNFYILLNMFFN
jgi:hypothetical protein